MRAGPLLAVLGTLGLLACAPAATRTSGAADHTDAPPHSTEKPMNGATSPSGDAHPGEILHDDRVDGRTWTEAAAAVPQSIAWAQLDGVWVPVVRIEITGTTELRRITRFGPDGGMLDTTTPPRPPPPPPSEMPVPVPVPTPD